MDREYSVELLDYTVIEVNSKFDNLYLGENIISMGTSVQLIPKETPDVFVCRLTIDCINEKGELPILNIVADGTVTLPNVNNEMESKINYVTAKLVYEHTQEFVTKFKEISNVKFIDLPPFETVAGKI